MCARVCVCVCVRRGAAPQVGDKRQWSALHHAAYNGHADVCDKLLTGRWALLTHALPHIRAHVHPVADLAPAAAVRAAGHGTRVVCLDVCPVWGRAECAELAQGLHATYASRPPVRVAHASSQSAHLASRSVCLISPPTPNRGSP